MEQVSLWRAGEADYSQLQGGTGPLVYPAGFVHLFAALQRVTRGAVLPAQVRALERTRCKLRGCHAGCRQQQHEHFMQERRREQTLRRKGADRPYHWMACTVWSYNGMLPHTHAHAESWPSVHAHAGMCLDLQGGRRVQVIWAGAYLATQAAVMRLYIRSRAVPPYVLILLTLSKRMHSIFVLRLFNDCWAMLIAYAATSALATRRRIAAIVAFAVAVSVKMNVLLFAPGVLAVCLQVRLPRHA